MPDGVGSHHAGPQQVVSALRTALVGRAVLRFDGPGVDGPSPTLGRVIERVQRRGRRIQIVWDDGLILHTRLGFSGVWHLYREGEPWRKPFADVRAAITVPGWVAACFKAPYVETYREFDRHRHPGFGRSAPDLAATAISKVRRPPAGEARHDPTHEITRNLARHLPVERIAEPLEPAAMPGGSSGGDPDVVDCARRLAAYADPDVTVAEALLDPHVAFGIGSVYRCEALWRCGVHPFARVGDLAAAECFDLVATAAALLRHNADQAVAAAPVDTREGLVVYGRNGQRCERCGDTIEVCHVGWPARMLYWCAGCQVAHDPDRIIGLFDGGDDIRHDSGLAGRHDRDHDGILVGPTIHVDDTPEEIRSGLRALVMDPHPAATRFVADLPWRRTERAEGTGRTGRVAGTGATDRSDRVGGTGRTDRVAGTGRSDRVGGTGATGRVAGTGGTDRVDRAG